MPSFNEIDQNWWWSIKWSLDTKEVMNNKVGQWYKNKGEGAYIVIDGN